MTAAKTKDLANHATFSSARFSAKDNTVELVVSVADATKSRLWPSNSMSASFLKHFNNCDMDVRIRKTRYLVDEKRYISKSEELTLPGDMTPQDCLDWAREQYKNIWNDVLVE